MSETKQRLYYSNQASLQFSLYDFRVGFNSDAINVSAEADEISDIKIIMSPQHAKSLYNILKEGLENYEANFGVIPGIKDILHQKD